MTKITGLICMIFILVFASGCKFFQKDEAPQEPEETTITESEGEETAVESEAKEKVEEAEAEEVETKPTLVSQEDIERASKLYGILHSEELKDAVKGEKFVKLLEEFGWDIEKYEQIIFDIGRDSNSSKLYKETQGNAVKKMGGFKGIMSIGSTGSK